MTRPAKIFLRTLAIALLATAPASAQQQPTNLTSARRIGLDPAGGGARRVGTYAGAM